MKRSGSNDIAIIGAAGRFPGADNLAGYWEILSQGKVICDEPGPERDALLAVTSDARLREKIKTLKAGYISGVDGFDAEFFNISRREAVKLDPQQRLLLAVVNEALEDANLTRSELDGKNVGVFVGAGSNDYASLDSQEKSAIDAYHGLGNSHSILANRISYYFNLKGPSLTIDTACSSSMTALHYGILSIETGQIDIAIIGGASLILSPDLTLAFSQANMLSPSGRCLTFSEAADGYGRGEAIAAVVIRRLDAAVANGNPIRCLIKGSAINQDGRSNGITAPNGNSQINVIRSALVKAGLQPGNISYFEAHGTGTPLGDAIEYNAIKAVAADDPDEDIYLGSAKANIGHTEAAAGLCGILKAMLMLEHRKIPPHVVSPPYNKLIKVGNSHLKIAQCLRDMDVRRANVGVSSFGFGGANAHAVLAAYDSTSNQTRTAETEYFILPLSSHYANGLGEYASRLADNIAADKHDLAAVAYSAGRGRDHYKYRKAVVFRGRDDCIRQLTTVTRAQAKPVPTQPLKIAFVLTGQGAQSAAMGKDLFEAFPAYRSAFCQCDEHVQDVAGISMRECLYGQAGDAFALLTDTHLAQLALFCFEYALARLWQSLAITPAILIGHSIGELVAHAVAGVLCLADAVGIVHERGRLMQAVDMDAAMTAVMADEQRVLEMIKTTAVPLYIAARNSRTSIVVSGLANDVSTFEASLKAVNIQYRRLKTRHAFHTPYFGQAAQQLSTKTAGCPLNAPTIPLVSNLDGRVIIDASNYRQILEAPAAGKLNYWGQHIISAVDFNQGVRTLIEQGVSLFVEVGPRNVLNQLVSAELRQQARQDIVSIASIQADGNEVASFLNAVGQLYCAGPVPDFSALYSDEVRQVRLPVRPYKAERHWRFADERQSDTNPPRRAEQSAGKVHVEVQEALPQPAVKQCGASVFDRQLQLMKTQLELLGAK